MGPTSSQLNCWLLMNPGEVWALLPVYPLVMPIDGSKPRLTEKALVKLSGSQKKIRQEPGERETRVVGERNQNTCIHVSNCQKQMQLIKKTSN